MCDYNALIVCRCCGSLVELLLFRWYSLKAKPGSKKADQNRGELEVTATFLVQRNMSQSQSSLSIEKKTKKSLSVRNLAHSFSKFVMINIYDLMLILLLYVICSMTSVIVFNSVLHS